MMQGNNIDMLEYCLMDREFKMQHTMKDGWFRKVELTISFV